VFDLGVSSPQLDDAARGFSFSKDGPLDMRMDTTRGQPASVWLEHASLDEIRHVIATLGEERFANRIAGEIVRTRGAAPLHRTAELATLVARCVRTHERGKNPATRTFQALRMFINDELGQIERGLTQALDLLGRDARLVAISFHSLEDRLVKQFIRTHSELDPVLAKLPIVPLGVTPALRRIGRKIRAGAAELASNPRSRSAVMRVAQRQL
jgi:16S rRNA (cytosine1402-N4)-methyltransferase